MAPWVCSNALVGWGRATSQDEKAAGLLRPTSPEQSPIHTRKTPELRHQNRVQFRSPARLWPAFLRLKLKPGSPSGSGKQALFALLLYSALRGRGHQRPGRRSLGHGPNDHTQFCCVLLSSEPSPPTSIPHHQVVSTVKIDLF